MALQTPKIDVNQNLPTYEEILNSSNPNSSAALGLQSGLSGLVSGMQLRRQADQDKAARLAAAEKTLLERAQAKKAQTQAETEAAKEARLTESGKANREQELSIKTNYLNFLKKKEADDHAYHMALLDAHKSGNNKDVLKIKSAFDKTYNQPLQDAQAALDEFKNNYEAAVKEGSVGSAATSPLNALKSAGAVVSGGVVRPKFAVFRKSLNTLVPSLQKGLGVNRTSTAEIQALTKGAPSGFEDPNVGRQYIQTIQNVLDKKRKENTNLIKSQIDLLRTGTLPEAPSYDQNPMSVPATTIKPPINSFIEDASIPTTEEQ